MHPEEYAKMYRQENSYWWFQGRKQLIISILDRLESQKQIEASSLVVDLGCGTGLMLDHIRRRYRGVGVDFSPLALRYCRERGIDRLVQANVEQLPLADDCADLVIALDLAEHVPDDKKLFGEIFRILKPGGQLILTVPAHPFLWSEHDDALFHFRRYRKEELRQRLQEAGLEVDRLTYCISFTYPLIVGFRLFQRTWRSLLRKQPRQKTHLIMLPRWLNTLLRWSISFESLLLRRINLPFGVTLLALASRPAVADNR